MALYPSDSARARIIDRYTPPASIDEPVRASRVPHCGCQACGRVGHRHQRGRPCACGAGDLAALPADAWRWCPECRGSGIGCRPCEWHGVVLRTVADLAGSGRW